MGIEAKYKFVTGHSISFRQKVDSRIRMCVRGENLELILAKDNKLVVKRDRKPAHASHSGDEINRANLTTRFLPFVSKTMVFT